MFTHITGIGQRDRREKGRKNKPKVYLFVEFLLLSLVVFLISLLKIKFVTILSVLGALHFFMIFFLPHYSKIMKRQ